MALSRHPSAAFLNAAGQPRGIPLALAETETGVLASVGISVDNIGFPTWITGPMGRGKSVLHNSILRAAIMQNMAVVLMSPKEAPSHMADLLQLIPLERECDVRIIGGMDDSRLGGPSQVSLNPFVDAKPNTKIQAGLVMGLFEAIAPDFADSPSLQQLIFSALEALSNVESPITVLHLLHFLADPSYREQVLDSSNNQASMGLWSEYKDAPANSRFAGLKGLERRLERVLGDPSLASMLVSPGASLNIAELMRSRAIVLCGDHTEMGNLLNKLVFSQIIAAAFSLLLHIPSSERVPSLMLIDEAQMMIRDASMAMSLMQLRAARVQCMISNQSPRQFPEDVRAVISSNAMNRLILGASDVEMPELEQLYPYAGLESTDLELARFRDVLVSLMGSPLFKAHMLPWPEAVIEEAPPMNTHDWRTITAPAKHGEDQALDDLARLIQETAANNGMSQAVKQLSNLAPERLSAYAARTAEHRAAQRQFIIDNPGCIAGIASDDPSRRRQEQKAERIRVLSALATNIPQIETLAFSTQLGRRLQGEG